MFRKMPVILMGVIALVMLSFQWIPLFLQSFLYGISLSIKSLIVFALPFIIFGLLFKTTMQLAQKASKWIFFILAAICISNFTSTILSYMMGTFVYQLDLSLPPPVESSALIPWVRSPFRNGLKIAMRCLQAYYLALYLRC